MSRCLITWLILITSFSGFTAAQETRLAYLPAPPQPSPNSPAKALNAPGWKQQLERRERGLWKTGNRVSFEIQWLSIDAKTRRKLYQLIGDENVHTKLHSTFHADPSANLGAGALTLERSPADATAGGQENEPTRSSNRHQVDANTIVSTAPIQPSDLAAVLQLLQSGPYVKTISRPVIVTNLGEPGGVSTTNQSHYMTDVERVIVDNKPATAVNSRPISEGTSLQAKAVELPGNLLKIDFQMVQRKTAEVETLEVFGVGSEDLMVNAVKQYCHALQVDATVPAKHSLLIDPYMHEKVTVATDEKRKAFASHDVYQIILVTPRIQRPTDPGLILPAEVRQSIKEQMKR